MYQQWIKSLSREERELVTAAVKSASLSGVRRALKILREKEGSYLPLRVDLLSTQNLQPVLPFVEFALRCLPSKAEIQLAPLDDIEGYISQPSLTGSGPAEARVIVWRADEILPEAFFPVSQGFPDGLAARIEKVFERVDRVVGLHQKHAPGIPLFISTVAYPAYISNRLFNAQNFSGAFAGIARINARIHQIASAGTGVHVLNLADWAAGEGREYNDALLDFMARQPLGAAAQLSFSFFLARSLRPLLFPRRKVLAVDLDHTPWGGVIAEDGLEGVTLGHDSPGNIYLRLQREILELRERGILLVLLSKNNERDAREGFRSHP